MNERRFAIVLTMLSGLAIAGLVLLTEFVLLPAVLKVPREVLLLNHAAKPGKKLDGHVINRMGFTGDEVTHPKPPHTVRILVLGGSVMFNRHLGDRLKAALQARTANPVELLNAGLRTHTSRSDLYKMEHLANHDFDYVIYYNGINDLWMNAKYPMDFQADYSHYDASYREYPIFRHSLLARVLYKLWHKAYNRAFSSERDARAVNFHQWASIATFEQNLVSITDIARQHGAMPVLLTFASALPGEYSYDRFTRGQLGYINPTHYDQHPVELWGDPAYVKEGLVRINDRIRNVAAREQLPLIDIEAELGGQIALFGDVCHFNDAGVDRFVEIVATRFQREGWLNAPPQARNN